MQLLLARYNCAALPQNYDLIDVSKLASSDFSCYYIFCCEVVIYVLAYTLFPSMSTSTNLDIEEGATYDEARKKCCKCRTSILCLFVALINVAAVRLNSGLFLEM